MGKELDNRVDVYASGIMLFQMLVGNLPFAPYKTTRELLKLKIKGKWLIRRPSEINPAADEEMDRIVLKATALEPEERYATCRDFSEDLRKYAAEALQTVMI